MFLRPEPELGWFPTHVQVTILEAKGLRAKGKHGTSDAYTLIQVGREKYSTSVVEKTPGSPEWKEECTFELSPGALERGENCELQLTIMHRALIGMDQFLGQVTIPLHRVFQEGRSQRNQWYKLHSKPGKKEKERGEIQVSIQFTRNNLTASMFDLSMKDKPKTPFGKLKDKMKIKKRFDMESSSAIVPSSVGRLDSDEEEEKKPKSKAAAFFKGHLRKSSLTRSNTSLGSDSTVSSSSGAVPNNSAISIVVSDAGKKPAVRNSSLSAEPSVMDHEASPRLTHKRAFSDEVSQVNVFPEPKAVQNLKPKNSPISKSSVCINGSHVYAEVPLPKSPSLEKSSQASRSFQNILKKAEEAVTPEVMRQSNAGEKQERKLATPPVSSKEEEKHSLKMTPKPKTDQTRVETKPVQVTSPMVFTEDLSNNKALEGKAKEEKAKDGPQLGSGKNEGGNKSTEDPQPHVPSSSEERSKVGGWFGSKDVKDTLQKPSPIKFRYVESSQTENRVASVSPLLIKEQVIDNTGDLSPSSEHLNDYPAQRSYSLTMTPIAESAHELKDSTDVIVEEVKASLEPRQLALIEHNFVRIGEDFSPEPVLNKNAPVEERFNELIKEQAISEYIGSLPPPKPQRLMLSPAYKLIESNVDNCKQTSFQDTSGKQTESPEEHELDQNMRGSKHTHSPVACCPVIEISPVLGSTTEDTQSTTEGFLTNLREGNNEFPKLGAANGEHLSDVNDTSAAEQFRTCPSSVSLDFPSLQENSNKLEVINHGPSELLPKLGDDKQDNEDFIFQKPVPFPKKQKGNRTEDASASKKQNHSEVLFWSALEEQVTSSTAEPTRAVQNVHALLESNEHSNQECKAEPKHNKNTNLIRHSVESLSPPPNELTNYTLGSSERILVEESPSVLLSLQSPWSADIIVDFKNEDFWKTDSNQLTQNDIKSLPSPGNPFTPTDKTPLSHKNPFVDHPRESQSSESSLPEDLSFKDLHAQAAGQGLQSAVITTDVKTPFVHGNQPLAFSTPFFATAPCPKPSNFPSPIQFSTASGVTTTTNTHTATLSYLRSPAASGVTSPAPVVLPQETQPAENPFMPLKTR
uniref:C2 domain-containing protein n=1 Tax=Pyxicephalus adspersus TaxID=30357 RepID=A0AAV3ANT1_PYXAD|nr:TPA: hypothetical protein GDO54_009709 [Pyxicephalus adspersus]